MKRFAVLPLIVLVLTACSDDAKPAASTEPTGNTVISYQLMTAIEGKDLIDSGVALTIIDVRTPDEFATGHLEGAVNSDIEGGQFSTYIATLDKTATYVLYCHSGRRAALAAQAMADAGFTDVHDIGSIADWQAAGYPVVQ